MSTTIELKSGTVTSKLKIIGQIRSSVIKSIGQTVATVRTEEAKLAPRGNPAKQKNVGRSRKGVIGGHSRLVVRAIAKARGQSTIKLLESDLRDLIVAESKAPYTKYHVRGHISFNPQFAGGYKRPSKRGTQPINPARSMKKIKKRLKSKIKQNLRQGGLGTI